MRRFMPGIAVALLLCAPIAASGGSQTAQVLVGANEPIKKGFKTYSLFLVCNPGWIEPGSAVDTKTQFLYQSFLNFGHAIGDDNLAVWFWSSPTGTKRTQLSSENIDVERSARFCKAWNLTPSEGPHLVVTSTFPNEGDLKSGLPKNSAVFKLGNMTGDQITQLLTKLTDQLLLSGKVDQGGAESPPPASKTQVPPPLWVRLLDAVQTSINGFGCAWTFKVDAGPVKADLHACQTKPDQSS